MKKEELKKMAIVAVVTGSVVATSMAGCQMIVNYNNKAHTIENMEGLKDNFSIKKSIVTGLKEEVKLNVLQVQAKSTTTIHNNRATMGLFKNDDIVTFVGNVSYSIDFSDISEEQVNVEGRAITLTLREPSLGEVSINEDLTTIQKQEGILSWVFEENNLTQEEYLMLTKSVKEDIQLEALKEIQTAKNKAEQQIENLINKLTKEDYQVKINFVK